MGVPVFIGVCQQASSSPTPPPPKTLTIGNMNLVTVAYGNVATSDPEPQAIPNGERLTASLSEENEFTFERDTLAQFYSGSNPAQQVFTAFQVTYTADNFDIDDMPDDGSCFIEWKFNNFSSTPSHAGIWPISGNTEGLIIPQNSKIAGIQWGNNEGLDKSESFQTTPIVGDVLNLGIPITTSIISGDETLDNNNTPRLNFIPLAAQKLGEGATTFTLSLKITLKDGTFATGSQIITVPENAIKENIVSGGATPTVIQVRTQALISTPFANTTPQTALPIEDQLICLLDSENEFTAGRNQMIYETSEEESASHSFSVAFDTNGINIEDFDEETILRYVITSGQSAESIGFLSLQDDEPIFLQTVSFIVPTEEYITGRVVQGPQVLLDNDAQFKISTALNERRWDIRVEFEKANREILASPDQTIRMTDTVLNL